MATFHEGLMASGHTMVFYASWSDYEEGGWCAITEKDGQYYEHSGGHCVMADPCTDDAWLPAAVTQDEALATMLEWAEDEDVYWSW